LHAISACKPPKNSAFSEETAIYLTQRPFATRCTQPQILREKPVSLSTKPVHTVFFLKIDTDDLFC
jgi:hypothetical protein